MNRLIFSILITGIGVLLPACSSQVTLHETFGEVTFNGKPIPTGDIKFSPEDKQLGSHAGKIENGKFSLKAREGKYKVQITATKMEPVPKGQEGAMGEKEAPVDYIPEIYNTKTTLTATVPSSGPLKFELKAE